MSKFIVIDTETTWYDEVMSIGAVVADSDTMSLVETKYYIIDPEFRRGGMYSYVLRHPKAGKPLICKRSKAIEDLLDCGARHGVSDCFAYKVKFDLGHLPELSEFRWHDIMNLAAYRQYNCAIPANASLCSTGRLKSGYGVESILRLLSGDCGYYETHNALLDAIDELRIMVLLGHSIEKYI